MQPYDAKKVVASHAWHDEDSWGLRNDNFEAWIDSDGEDAANTVKALVDALESLQVGGVQVQGPVRCDTSVSPNFADQEVYCVLCSRKSFAEKLPDLIKRNFIREEDRNYPGHGTPADRVKGMSSAQLQALMIRCMKKRHRDGE